MTYLYILSSIVVGALGTIWYLYVRPHKTDATSPPASTPPPSPLPQETVVDDPQPEPIVPPESMLDTLCTAIRDFEGKPGDPNYLNNNPLNFRCSPVGYLPKYGKVTCTPGDFAKFSTYDLGWEYGVECVHHTARLHPTWTLLQFIAHRAPPEDHNDPEIYAKFVANRCRCTIETTLGQLLG